MKSMSFLNTFIFRECLSQVPIVDDRKRNGHRHVIRTNSAMKAVRERIRRNHMSMDMDISTRLMSRHIRNHLHMKSNWSANALEPN